MPGEEAAGQTGANAGGGIGSSYSFGGGWDLGILSGAINYGYGQAAESQAWKRQKKMWRKGPSYIVEGLRRAGINPLLAFGKGAPGVGSAQMGPVGPGTDLPGAILKAAQAKQAKAQLDLTDAQTDLVTAQAEGARADARLKELDIPGQENQAIVSRWLQSVLTTADEAARNPRETGRKLLNLVWPDEFEERARKARDKERMDRVFKKE